jgi:hypothetical protein
MHPVVTIRHWSHHLHDGMLTLRRQIDQHLHSRHFWIGVGAALLIIGLVTLFIVVAQNAPFVIPTEYPAGSPYIPYR